MEKRLDIHLHNDDYWSLVEQQLDVIEAVVDQIPFEHGIEEQIVVLARRKIAQLRN